MQAHTLWASCDKALKAYLERETRAVDWLTDDLALRHHSSLGKALDLITPPSFPSSPLVRLVVLRSKAEER